MARGRRVDVEQQSELVRVDEGPVINRLVAIGRKHEHARGDRVADAVVVPLSRGEAPGAVTTDWPCVTGQQAVAQHDAE